MQPFSCISLHLSVLDTVSSCTLTNEYSWMNTVCACVCDKERALRLDNLLPQKLFHTEKLGWLLIDLIILLLYKDKKMNALLSVTNKTNKPAKEKGEGIKHFELEWKDVSVRTVQRSAGKLYLQTNLVSVLLELFFPLMSNKAFIISGYPQQPST